MSFDVQAAEELAKEGISVEVGIPHVDYLLRCVYSVIAELLVLRFYPILVVSCLPELVLSVMCIWFSQVG